MAFGIFQVGIALDNLRLGLREGARKAAEIGVDSVQLRDRQDDVDLMTLSPAGRRDEAKRVRDLGLGISAVCILPGEGDYATPENMRRALLTWVEVARDLGAPVITTRFIGVARGQVKSPFGGFLPPAPFDVVAAIAPAVRAAADAGITFAHETGLEPPEDVAAFVDSFDSPGIGANYDPANLLAFGYDPLGGVAVIGNHIAHVHAKDGRKVATGGFGFEEATLGTGGVDFPAFLRALRRVGFGGCLALEREATNDPVGEMTAGVRFLREKIAELEKEESGHGR